ncbi:MAG: GNAT family N-acetyltransferase [Candidatus Promineifilaceae bacterium]|nr:GNAT family N-acetyltransferase [Candidatus Promineifilaceae bacterium]
MQDNPIHSLERIGDAVLLRGDSDHRWVYISAVDEAGLAAVVERLIATDIYFAIIEDWMIPILSRGRQLDWQLTTRKLLLPEQISLNYDSYHVLERLIERDAATILANSHYDGFTSIPYLVDRIKRGPNAGIRISGDLVAWILTHDDGAIGNLHVLDEYRRKGMALDLLVYLSQRIRQLKRVPFVHIEEDNFQSTNLARKIGYQPDRRVHWLKFV